MSEQSYLLKRLKTTRFPGRFIVLDYQSPVAGISVYDYADGMWNFAEGLFTKDLDLFWCSLKSWCQSRVNTWLVGWRIYESLCELGIYDQLEAGTISLKKKRRRSEGSEDQSTWTQQAGALICNSPPTIIDLQLSARRELRVIDLANWGLEQPGPDWTPNQDRLEVAVEALQDYVCMVRTLEMGTLQATAAGQGYTRFRTHDLTSKISVHQDRRVRKLERSAHFGGRCEAYQIGLIEGPLYYVDVKAMYSYIASIERFPTDLVGIFNFPAGPNCWRQRLDEFVIGSVTITTDQPIYPVRIGGHTYYPTGKFITSLADPELRMANYLGHITAWHQWARYKTDYVWRDYAKWYFASLDRIETEGLVHMRSALKLAVNASYGKVGAMGKLWVDCDPDGSEERWGQWWREHPTNGSMTQGRAINGIHQYLDDVGEPPSSMPMLAAAMPSYGRAWAWCLMCSAGRDNVHYIDTDGMIVNEAGFANLADLVVACNARPGNMTVRGIFDSADILGLKHYRLGDEWVQSGVPRSAERTIYGRAEWDQVEPFSYGLWHGEPFQAKTQRMTRYGARPYEHGTVGPDGRISPLRADVLDGPDGPETMIYGRYGEIRESTCKKILHSKPR